MTPPPKPHPRISPKHYAPEPAKTAKVRWRIKGHQEGPIYQGQQEITPCQACGTNPPTRKN